MATATATAPTQTLPPTSSAQTHPYTCNTCQVAFKGSDLQRGHMQSDWHRYNLKRRVASLPPLSSEIFAEKVLANQASAAATAARARFEKTCAACARTYFSENAYTNHLKSQKHRAKLAEIDAERTGGLVDGETTTEDGTESMASSMAFSMGDTESMDTARASEADGEVAQAADGIQRARIRDPEAQASTAASETISSSKPDTYPASPTTTCLFCTQTFPGITDNLTHMSRTHGLFIPEQTYLVDLPGLLSYLHERVHILHECLSCGQVKYTSSGVQTHMRDKGHCTIAFETEEEMVEVGQFYDFSSTYSDDEEEEDDSDQETDGEARKPTPKAKLGATRVATYETEDLDGDDDNDDWEEDSEDDSNASSSEDDVDGNTSRKSARPTPATQAYADNTTLHLPSGRQAGHRSLARYYRQNLHNYPTAAERSEMARQQRLLTADGHTSTNGNGTETVQRGRTGRALVTRAGGGLGLLAADAETKEKAKKAEVRERKRGERRENRYKAGLERRGNQQKYYRDPLLQ